MSGPDENQGQPDETIKVVLPLGLHVPGESFGSGGGAQEATDEIKESPAA